MLRSLIDDNEIDNNQTNKASERVFVKLHGFRDSPVSLIKLDTMLERKMRINEENYLSICYKFNQNCSSYDAIYKDFKKIFIVSDNK